MKYEPCFSLVASKCVGAVCNEAIPMIMSGNQIRAARALIGWRRDELAAAAGLHPNAVKYYERQSSFSDRERAAACPS